MNWDELSTAQLEVKKTNEQAREKAARLAQAYHGAFGTSQGQLVLEDLSNRFIYSNDTPFSSANIDYEAAFHNGEAGVVKFIHLMLQRAGEL